MCSGCCGAWVWFLGESGNGVGAAAGMWLLATGALAGYSMYMWSKWQMNNTPTVGCDAQGLTGMGFEMAAWGFVAWCLYVL